MLADLDTKKATLEQTLLRVSGAIQVLEELLDSETEPSANGGLPPEEALQAEMEMAETSA
jgi:hypothetical protein